MFQPNLAVSAYFSGVVALKQKDRILLKKAYGVKDSASFWQTPFDTMFCIGSLTKMFTACAILLLQERRQLHTEDCIVKFFPECPKAKNITIHQLLSHTSGLVNYTDDEEIWRLRTKEISPKDLIKTFIQKPLIFSPGSRYSYSNSGYALLGAIIERVSGLSYGAFLKQHIFDPLHMHSTQYGLPSKKRSSTGFSLTAAKENIQAPLHQPSFAFAAGGIYSTLEDLLLWDQQLFTLQLITRESVEKMLYQHCFTNAEKTMGYGYGMNVEWLSDRKPGIKHIWHRGRLEGFSSLYSKYLQSDTTLIILANNDQLLDEIKSIENQVITFCCDVENNLPLKKSKS